MRRCSTIIWRRLASLCPWPLLGYARPAVAK